jgi:methylamine dehydrogenase light chain
MHPLDGVFEKSARLLAKRTSRRGLLGALGQVLTGAALLPLLPIDRTARAQTPAAGASSAPSSAVGPSTPRRLPTKGTEVGELETTAEISTPGPVAKPTADEQNCQYWKFCAIDGFLCGCCGGTSSSCPPGTQSSPITWIGTCHNPNDGRNYIVSYNDCCGKVSCGDCFCNRNEGETPMYRLSRNNDVNWCMANTESNYHCSVSVILGVAEK